MTTASLAWAALVGATAILAALVAAQRLRCVQSAPLSHSAVCLIPLSLACRAADNGVMTAKILPMLLAGAAIALFAAAAPAAADPTDCVNPDGTPCNVVTPDGATGGIPGGPAGTAGPDVVEGSIPGGPSGQVTPGEVSGCIPGIGCINVPR